MKMFTKAKRSEVYNLRKKTEFEMELHWEIDVVYFSVINVYRF
jgi:hypothetical protein